MKERRNTIIAVSLFIIFVIVLVVFLQRITTYLHLSSSVNSLVVSIVIIVLGSIIINFIDNKIFKRFFRTTGMKKRREQNIVNFMFLFISYFILVLIVLRVLNIDITNILLGSAFIGVILGLASQSVLANLFAGIVVLMFNQFEIGERVKITTWQYNFLLPSYPTKFYSADLLIPGYTGVIYNVGIFYTDIMGDDGFPLKIPNSILIQAAVQKFDKVKKFKTQVKYEIEKSKKFSDVKLKIESIMQKASFKVESFDIYIDETSFTTYIIKVVLYSSEKDSDRVKSYVLESLVESI
jgi:small-conductance mechanosensitive channel